MQIQQRRIAARGRQRGQGMTEYIIITALIAIAAIAAITAFGGTVRSGVAGMAKELSGQSATPQIGDAKQSANTSATEAKKTKGMDAYNNK